MFAFLFICSLLVPLSMIVLGKRWCKIPPKERNGFSGYRTHMAGLTQDTWEYAHRYWGKINYILGVVLAIMTIVILVIIRGQSNFETAVTYLVFVQIAVMTLTMVPTEIKLHKVFDKNGRRK